MIDVVFKNPDTITWYVEVYEDANNEDSVIEVKAFPSFPEADAYYQMKEDNGFECVFSYHDPEELEID